MSAMECTFRILEGPDAGKTLSLDAGGEIVLGRSAHATCRLADGQVSRRHCRFAFGPKGLCVEDLGSSNGTFVNGTRIEGPEPVREGDVVQLGDTVIALADASGGRRPAFCVACGNEADGSHTCPRGIFHVPMPDGAIPGLVLKAKIGTGGMGAVFLARQTSLERDVALKTMVVRGDPPRDKVQRFLREARIPAALQHPNIVSVFNVGSFRAHAAGDGGGVAVAYVVMEYMQGRDLTRIVKEDGFSDWRQAVRLAVDVAGALAFTGERGVVHRDIKPQNILVTDDATVKLMDFGLAKNFEKAGLSGVTSPGVSLGTPAYMAPEQIQDALKVGPPADQYAFGATLFFMLAGRPPIVSQKVGELLRRVTSEPAPRLETLRPDVPPPIADIVARCLEKTPDARFPDAAALQRALEASLES